MTGFSPLIGLFTTKSSVVPYGGLPSWSSQLSIMPTGWSSTSCQSTPWYHGILVFVSKYLCQKVTTRYPSWKFLMPMECNMVAFSSQLIAFILAYLARYGDRSKSDCIAVRSQEPIFLQLWRLPLTDWQFLWHPIARASVQVLQPDLCLSLCSDQKIITALLVGL